MHNPFPDAFRELGRRKGRSAAAITGYALAAAVTVILVTIIGYSEKAAGEILTVTGTHFIAYSPAEASTLGTEEGFRADTVFTNLIPMKTVEDVRKVPFVKDASPYLLFAYRNDGGMLTMGGFDPSDDTAVRTTCCSASDLVEGRFLSPGEEGTLLAEEAWAKPRGLRAGDTVTLGGEPFTAAGIVNTGIRPAKADVYLPLSTARRLINAKLPGPTTDEVNMILVEVESSKRQPEVLRDVKKLVAGGVVSSYNCFRPAAQVLRLNENSALLLALVTGLFALAFAAKTQIASVIERRRDIGILMAIGWTELDIASQIVAESVLLSEMGGLLGFCVSSLLLPLIPPGPAGGSPGNTVTSGWTLPAVALLLSVAGGVLAGIVPALIAARKNPAEVLRMP